MSYKEAAVEAVEDQTIFSIFRALHMGLQLDISSLDKEEGGQGSPLLLIYPQSPLMDLRHHQLLAVLIKMTEGCNTALFNSNPNKFSDATHGTQESSTNFIPI